MRILIDATLPLINTAFPKPFIVNTYASLEELHIKLPQQDMLICRSTLKVDATLLKDISLKWIATASSGTDHIDKKLLKNKGIQLIDAKGCNAHSVADYVLSILAALRRAGIHPGRKAGLIGKGAVGSEVLKRLKALDFDIQIFDPLLSMKDPSFISCALKDLISCDILFIHAELHDDEPWPSRNLIEKNFLHSLRPGTILVNASRGGIVNEKELLELPFQLHYCTDVYLNEPSVNPEIIAYATFCTPHIAGHSIEAKDAAIILISQQLHACLDLPPPCFSKSVSGESICLNASKTLDTQILKLYDPLPETRLLKNSAGDSDVFLNVRAHHNKRHDFLIKR